MLTRFMALIFFLISLPLWASNHCSIEIDYGIHSEWGAHHGQFLTPTKKFTRQLEELLTNKGYEQIIWKGEIQAEFKLKIHANVTALYSPKCPKDKHGCFEESASMVFENNRIPLERNTRRIVSRPLITFLADADYAMDPRGYDNARPYIILSKKRLNTILIELVNEIPNCF